MKKLGISILVTTFALSGCVAPNATTGAQGGFNAGTAINTGMVFGKMAFQTAVTSKCQSELASNKVWRTAKTGLSTAQQTQIPANVCGCVGTESSNNITIDQLTIAAISKTSRNTLIANSVSNTLSSCYGKFMTR